MKREPITYPPGFFAEPVYAWWPNFKPALSPEPPYMAVRRKSGQKGAGALLESTATSYFVGRRNGTDLKGTAR